MHVKTLKKLQAQVKRLEELDSEIIKIEQYAQKIKDKHLSIQLELSHAKAGEETVSFDEDGSMVRNRSILHGLIYTPMFEFGTGARSEDKKDSCKLEISEVIGLEVLGVMVAHKHAERMVIINQLRKAGFEISI